MELSSLKHQRDFSHVKARGYTVVKPGFVLKGAARIPSTLCPQKSLVRVGVIASRKVGSAVKRNFAKRRLRALVSRVLRTHALPGIDYCLIARSAVLTRQFSKLEMDLSQAVGQLNGKLKKARA